MTKIQDTEKKITGLNVVKLREIISGKPGTLTPKTAINQLAKKAGPENSKLFQQIFLDEKQKPSVRSRALEQYLISGEKKPETFLIKNLANANPEIMGAVVKEMGKYGGTAGLQALYDLKLKDSALIGFRNLSMLMIASKGVKTTVQPLKKIKVPEVTVPKMNVGAPVFNPIPAKNSLPDAKMVSKSIEFAGLKGKLFYSQEIICGKEKLALCLAEPMANSPRPDSVSLEGAVFIRDECPEGYSLQSYIFFVTGKTGSGKIIAMNTRGKVLYTGKGSLKEGSLAFEIQSVRNSLYPNTALSVSGVRKGKEFTVTRAENGIVDKALRILTNKPVPVAFAPAVAGK